PAATTTPDFVLAMSVTTLPPTWLRSALNTSGMERIGTATTTTSAMSMAPRSLPATLAMPRSIALRTVAASWSKPTIVISGRAFFTAIAKEAPIKPRPTTPIVGIARRALSELLGERAQQPAQVLHQAVEAFEVERLRAIR